jgi:hypothetical protein
MYFWLALITALRPHLFLNPCFPGSGPDPTLADSQKNKPVKRPDWQSGRGQKISSGDDSDADRKYRYNRLFSKNTRFNQEKIGQFSGPAAAPENRMAFRSI